MPRLEYPIAEAAVSLVETTSFHFFHLVFISGHRWMQYLIRLVVNVGATIGLSFFLKWLYDQYQLVPQQLAQRKCPSSGITRVCLLIQL